MEFELLLFFLVTFGALLTSLTGLGGGTLILAGLLLVYPPQLAIPLHSFTQLSANGLRTAIFFKKVNWKVVGAYALLMIPFTWGAAKLFDLIDPNWLKIVVGTLILISVLPLPIRPKDEPKLSTFVWLGALSGFLGVFVGAVGPMVVPFFNRLKLSREGMLTTKSAGQMMLQLTKIIAFAGAAEIDFVALKDFVIPLFFGALLGVAISIPIGKKISDAKLNRVVDILLVLIALKVIVEGLRGLLAL